MARLDERERKRELNSKREERFFFSLSRESSLRIDDEEDGRLDGYAGTSVDSIRFLGSREDRGSFRIDDEREERLVLFLRRGIKVA